MQKQNTEGHIVNTSSMGGLLAEPQLVIYSAVKAAVIKFSEGLYLQLKQQKSKVGASVLCPAFVTSRFGEAERNRPAALQNPPEKQREKATPSVVGQFAKSVPRLTPEENADIVFKAIRAGTFYIFTDPLVTELFRQRAENILNGKNPEMPRFG